MFLYIIASTKPNEEIMGPGIPGTSAPTKPSTKKIKIRVSMMINIG